MSEVPLRPISPSARPNPGAFRPVRTLLLVGELMLGFRHSAVFSTKSAIAMPISEAPHLRGKSRMEIEWDRPGDSEGSKLAVNRGNADDTES